MSTRSPPAVSSMEELHPLSDGKLISGRLKRLQGTRSSTQTDQALFLLWLLPATLGLGLGCVHSQTSVMLSIFLLPP